MSKSNAEYVAEAVTAIPAWKAFLARKRGEVEAQIAQMQAAHSRTGMTDDTLPLVIPMSAMLNAGDDFAAEALPPEAPVIAPTPDEDAALPPAGEIVAEFEAALAEADVYTLPIVVQDALGYRHSDPDCFARVMVAAQRRGLLPERLGYATVRMMQADYRFTEAFTLYDSRQYPELFEDTANASGASDKTNAPSSPDES